MQDALVGYLDKKRFDIEKTWSLLHETPEKAFCEEKTSDYLAERLASLGYATETGLAGTGVIGTYSGKEPGPTVGLRAELDAISHEIDGKTKILHSCAHDANCTMILAAADALIGCGAINRGKLKIIYQPAEETLQGARCMVETGALNDLDYLFGIHLRPSEELVFGQATPSIRHGASEIFSVVMKGKSAHGARPHQGINAIEAAVLAINGVNQIKLNPGIPHSIKVTSIKGGGHSFNVIPEYTSMTFDLRAQTNQLMSDLKKKVEGILFLLGQACGVQTEMEWKGTAPAAQDCQEAVELASRSIINVLGATGLSLPFNTSGAEDFHVYPLLIPNLKACVIGIGADLKPGLHQLGMTFNHEAMAVGTKIISLMTAELLA